MTVSRNIPVEFTVKKTYEVADTRFVEVSIKLMHTEENYNGSFFSKEIVESAIPSLANTPILAYIEQNSNGEIDYSDHRQILVKEDGELKIKYVGQAIGVIPETNNARFEKITTESGVEREYLIVDGLLWTKWDDPIDIIQRDTSHQQSMEIHQNYQGRFEEDNLFHFTYFQFFGACALSNIDVLPAMEEASIELKFTMEDFKKEIQFKMEQFKNFTLQNQPSITLGVDDIKTTKNFEKEVNLKLDKKIELLAKYNLKVESLSFNIEDMSLEDLEVKVKEQFSLSNSQLMTEIDKILQTMKEVRENYWGELVERRSFYLMDLKDNNAIVATYDWDTYYGIPYSENGDIVTLDFEGKVEFIPDWRPKQAGDASAFTSVKEVMDSEFAKIKEVTDLQVVEANEKFEVLQTEKTEIQTKLETITVEYEKVKPELEVFENKCSTLEAENISLKEFKSNIEVAQREAFESQQKELKLELVENFSKVLSSEEIKSVEDKNLSIEDMETKFKLIFASKELSTKFNKKSKKTETEIPILFTKKSDDNSWTSCIKK